MEASEDLFLSVADLSYCTGQDLHNLLQGHGASTGVNPRASKAVLAAKMAKVPVTEMGLMGIPSRDGMFNIVRGMRGLAVSDVVKFSRSMIAVRILNVLKRAKRKLEKEQRDAEEKAEKEAAKAAKAAEKEAAKAKKAAEKEAAKAAKAAEREAAKAGNAGNKKAGKGTKAGNAKVDTKVVAEAGSKAVTSATSAVSKRPVVAVESGQVTSTLDKLGDDWADLFDDLPPEFFAPPKEARHPWLPAACASNDEINAYFRDKWGKFAFLADDSVAFLPPDTSSSAAAAWPGFAQNLKQLEENIKMARADLKAGITDVQKNIWGQIHDLETERKLKDGERRREETDWERRFSGSGWGQGVYQMTANSFKIVAAHSKGGKYNFRLYSAGQLHQRWWGGFTAQQKKKDPALIWQRWMELIETEIFRPIAKKLKELVTEYSEKAARAKKALADRAATLAAREAAAKEKRAKEEAELRKAEAEKAVQVVQKAEARTENANEGVAVAKTEEKSERKVASPSKQGSPAKHAGSAEKVDIVHNMKRSSCAPEREEGAAEAKRPKLAE